MAKSAAKWATKWADDPALARIDYLLAEFPGYTGSEAALRIQTLGGFRVWRAADAEVEGADWGREKALQLVQFLITVGRQFLHKEQIIDRLWPELDADKGDRDFKVALNSANKALDPDREPRSEPRFVRRHRLAYGLDMDQIWLDSEVFEQLIEAGNLAYDKSQHGAKLAEPAPQESASKSKDIEKPAKTGNDATADKETEEYYRAIACYEEAVRLYHGDFLPERRYEDWTSAMRERVQVLALTTMTTLAELIFTTNLLEALRLTQRVLTIDPVWEDAYRVQMRAFAAQGNRPMALRTYARCVENLKKEFGVDPLPETQTLYEEIRKGKF
ncbi:MAG: bacterial transcriptional activator domain-containing protein [Litorilinea sp.]